MMEYEREIERALECLRINSGNFLDIFIRHFLSRNIGFFVEFWICRVFCTNNFRHFSRNIGLEILELFWIFEYIGFFTNNFYSKNICRIFCIGFLDETKKKHFFTGK